MNALLANGIIKFWLNTVQLNVIMAKGAISHNIVVYAWLMGNHYYSDHNGSYYRLYIF